MKKLYLLLLPIGLNAQTVTTLNVAANDVVFSNYSNKLYLTLNAANGASSNR